MENNNIQEKLQTWEKNCVAAFDNVKRHYYTQSPLDKIDAEPELMIIGSHPDISPQEKDCNFNSDTKHTFLQGNLDWNNRFSSDGKMAKYWEKYLWNVRFFLGYPQRYPVAPIDDENQTVWTNLTPFEANKENPLPKGALELGIPYTLELISILKPKRIVLMKADAFNLLKKNNPQNYPIDYREVLQYKNICTIGRICGIPTVCVQSYASPQWPVYNKFTSSFILLHKLSDIEEKGKMRSLDRVVKIMKDELRAWKKIPIE